MARALPSTLLAATALAGLALGGCAMKRSPGPRSTGEAARDAALQPLSDVNVVRPEIPPEIEAIIEEPYAMSAGATCAELAAEIVKLDGALGPDFDADTQEDEGRERRDRALGIAGRMGAGLLIPFRSVVREVTGSAGAEREYRAAMIAGIARRSYMKGWSTARGCPLPPPPEEPRTRVEESED